MRREPHVRFCERAVVRFRRATHLVAGFEHQADAERFLSALRQRLESFALSLHPDKTRLIEFGRFAAANRERRGLGKPETFNFLGFTHICGRTRNGKFSLRRKTRRDRLRAKLREVKETLRRPPARPDRRARHLAAAGRDRLLCLSCRAQQHPGARRLPARHQVAVWWRSLPHGSSPWAKGPRRSEKDRTTRSAINRLVARWLPRPGITHPWPEKRLPSPTQGGSRMP